MFDVVLVVGVAMAQLVVTWYAVDISVRDNRARNAAIIGAVGLLGLVLTGWAAFRTSGTQDKLQGQVTGLTSQVAGLKDDVAAVQKKLGENQNASVGLAFVALANKGQELKANVPVPFVVVYLVKANEAKNVRSYQEVFSMKGPETSNQNRDAHSQFMARAVPSLDFSGQDYISGSTFFRTLPISLQSREISELLATKRIIYVMARIEWKNVSGSDDHFDLCAWMEPPKMKYLIQSELPFHNCAL
jgi:outer membrane murein-binding lipoprotein Lpp